MVSLRERFFVLRTLVFWSGPDVLQRAAADHLWRDVGHWIRIEALRTTLLITLGSRVEPLWPREVGTACRTGQHDPQNCAAAIHCRGTESFAGRSKPDMVIEREQDGRGIIGTRFHEKKTNLDRR